MKAAGPEGPDSYPSFSTGRGTGSPFAPYVGDHIKVYAGYAADAADRQHVASGGLVTCLLSHALEAGFVDAVAVARASFADGQIGYQFELVTDPSLVQSFGTSAYFNIPIERHWSDIESFDGTVALCALPCHAERFRRRADSGRSLENLKLILSLFCGHNNEPELNRFVFEKEGIDPDDIEAVRVNRSYLGADVNVSMTDGSAHVVPFRHFNVYRSLGMFSKGLCHFCDDHLGTFGDISIGDVFAREYRNRDIKHSAAITRSIAGQELMDAAIIAGKVTVEEIDESVVFRAQRRILVPSNDLMSRYYASRAAGYRAKKPKQGRFRVRSFLTYTAQMWNDRLSRTRWGQRIFRTIPYPILYAYIALIKLVNNSLGFKSRQKRDVK